MIKKEKEEDKKPSEDTENRWYIIEKAIQLMQKGNTLDEAVDLIMQDKIIQKFDYWAKK